MPRAIKTLGHGRESVQILSYSVSVGFESSDESQQHTAYILGLCMTRYVGGLSFAAESSQYLWHAAVPRTRIHTIFPQRVTRPSSSSSLESSTPDSLPGISWELLCDALLAGWYLYFVGFCSVSSLVSFVHCVTL